MRVFRTTLILLAVAVGLALFIFLWEKPREERKRKEEKEQKTLVKFDRDDVLSIEIRGKHGFIKFARSGEKNWDIIKPIWAPADRFDVSPILSRYSDIEIERVIDEFATELTPYGLDRPSFTVTFYLRDGRRITVLLGKKSPVGYSIYAKLPDDPRVVLVSAALETVVDKKLEEFRLDKPLDWIVPDIKKLELITKQGRYIFERREGEWFIKFPESPTFLKGSDDAIRDLLYTLSDVKVKEFVSDASPPTNLYGLDSPDLMVRAVDEDGVLWQLDMKFENGKVWAKIPGRPNIYLVEISEKFAPRLELANYRKRKVFDFFVWRVKKVSVEDTTGVYEFERDKVQTEKWYAVRGNERKEADSSAVKDALRDISDIKVTHFVADSTDVSYFIPSPATRVIIDIEGRDTPLSFVLGKEAEYDGKKGVLGAIEGENSVYLFPKKITEPLHKLVETWLDAFGQQTED